MKNNLFLILVIILLSINLIYADTIQDSSQNRISQNQLTYTINNQKPPNPKEVLINAIQNNPEVRKEIIKSLIVIFGVMTLTILDLILKGFAMWKASKKNSKLWFWLLLLISSFGILPLLYLVLSKKENKNHEHKK
jgi:ABC-type glycerol-3-phosphate transport system permease component